MSEISIVAYSIMFTEMHYLFLLMIGQSDVDMCELCTAELLVTLTWHNYANIRRHNLMTS